MATFYIEKGTEFFSRFEKKDSSFLSLDSHILPQVSAQDVVEISGGPGSGKTELLYHLIVRCILPESTWNGLQLGGLNKRVVLIDNDLRFNLFRLIKILERRLRSLLTPKSTLVDAREISAFIDERLKLLDIFKCSNSEEFIISLRYLEMAQSQKYVLMIDGIMSFYWSSKMRISFSSAKIPEAIAKMTSLVKNISKSRGIPVIVTKRKLVSSSSYDRSMLPIAWRNLVTKQLELAYSGSNEKSSNIAVHINSFEANVQCAISNSGLRFFH